MSLSDTTFVQGTTIPSSWLNGVNDYIVAMEEVLVSVKHPDFGATGDGTTNDAAAINAAIVSVAASGKTLFFPPGTYLINTPLLIDSSSAQYGIKMLGCKELTIIKQSDATLPVAVLTGRNLEIDGFLWRHSTMPTTSNTRGCGWEIDGLVSQFHMGWNKFYKVYSAIQPSSSGTDAMFAGTMDHTIVHQWAQSALIMKALTGGNTPVYMNSVYCSNMGDDGTTEGASNNAALQMAAGQGPVFGHVHLENFTGTNAVFCGSDLDGANINALHIENFSATGNGALIDMLGNSASVRYPGLIIGDFQFTGCTFNNATVGGNSYAITKLGAGAQLVIQHLSERNNTMDITDFRVVRVYGAGDNAPTIDTALWVNSGTVVTATGAPYTTVILTADTSQDANSGLPSVLRRWLGCDYFRINDLGAAKTYEWWTAGGVAPLAGTWVRGSIVWNAVPAANGGGFAGWQCNVAGTPGTWKRFGFAEMDFTFTWDPGSLADGAGETTEVFGCTGAALGDYVLVGAPYGLQGITVTGYVSATNTVQVRAQNESGAVIDLASGTWRVRVIPQ